MSTGSQLDATAQQRQYTDQTGPHRVLIIAMRPGDELRYASSVLATAATAGQSEIANLSVLFVTKDGKELSAADSSPGNRAAEAGQVLADFGVDNIMYLGLGAARAPQTAPKALSSAGSESFESQPILALVDDLHAALRQVQPDTIILAVASSQDAAEQTTRLEHITELACERAESDGIGRAASYLDGTHSADVGILVLRSVLTPSALRNRNSALAQLAGSADDTDQLTVPVRQVQMHVPIPVDAARSIMDGYRRYTSRFALKQYDAAAVVVDSAGEFIPGGSDSFIETRHKAQALAAPATGLSQWRVFNEAVRQPSKRMGWVSAIMVLFGGVIAGLVLTLWHQKLVAAIPVGLILGCVIIAVLIIGMRLQQVPKIMLWAVAAGIVAGISWAAMAGQSEDYLIPGNLLGMIWAYGAPILTALLAFWPARRPKVR